MINLALWAAQVLLFVGFLLVGFSHAYRFDRFAAAPRMAWAHAVGRRNMQIIGLFEMAGAVGAIVPAVTGILPWLTPLAAAGLALIVLFAAVFHARRGELQAIASNAVLFGLAAFVLIGRTIVEPI